MSTSTKRTYHNFKNEELWSLDITIAKFILPRLKRFKKATRGHPSDLTEKQWDSILDKMIFSFDFIANERKMFGEDNDNNWKKVDGGLTLFAKWFNGLWW